MVVIILLANFGDSIGSEDVMKNSEVIEHKINIMLVLFDLRDECKINVVEVMLMAKTVLQGFNKVFPEVNLFKNTEILEEIKPTILKLFTPIIEESMGADNP